MKHLQLEVDAPLDTLHKKMGSMPMTTQGLKGRHSRFSSMIETTTTRSALSNDRYGIEAERLDWTIPELTDKHKNMYNACNKYKKHEAVAHFDYLASNYEGMYLRCGYPDPKYVADYVAKFAKKNKQDSNVKIMDLACGTGLVGQYLSE